MRLQFKYFRVKKKQKQKEVLYNKYVTLNKNIQDFDDINKNKFVENSGKKNLLKVESNWNVISVQENSATVKFRERKYNNL